MLNQYAASKTGENRGAEIVSYEEKVMVLWLMIPQKEGDEEAEVDDTCKNGRSFK